ncbi:MAG: OmpH family outer membrane protein [Aureibaculum sp.]|nr:OmpH family outer membrane protein [Aureibaculum sp.]
MMIRNILIFLAIVFSTVTVAQKPQRIGYIDMEYILENVPEYNEAQSRLNVKVATWQQKLDGIKREIEIMKTDLSNEKPLLTQELINEREEDIQIKEEDLKKLQAAYFGPTGDLYLLRKQLIKPVQDQIYNAVQNIAINKKYDIVLDKSSDLIMLYANKRFDVSELVLNSIVRGRKKAQLEEKKNQQENDAVNGVDLAQDKLDEKAKKREDLQNRLKLQQEAKAKKREELKNAAQEKRNKRLEEIENRKKISENKGKTVAMPIDSVNLKATESIQKTTDSIQKVSVKKAQDSIRDSKRAALLERLKQQQDAKAKKREEIKKAADEKRKKRLEEIEKRRKQIEANAKSKETATDSIKKKEE